MMTSFNFSKRGAFVGECIPRGSELVDGALIIRLLFGFVDEPLFFRKY